MKELLRVWKVQRDPPERFIVPRSFAGWAALAEVIEGVVCQSQQNYGKGLKSLVSAYRAGASLIGRLNCAFSQFVVYVDRRPCRT